MVELSAGKQKKCLLYSIGYNGWWPNIVKVLENINNCDIVDVEMRYMHELYEF